MGKQWCLMRDQWWSTAANQVAVNLEVPAPRTLQEDVVVAGSNILKECVVVVFTPTERAHKLSVVPY